MAELEVEAIRETMLAMMGTLTARVIAASVLADERACRKLWHMPQNGLVRPRFQTSLTF